MKLRSREYFWIKYKMSLKQKAILDEKYEQWAEYQYFAKKKQEKRNN